MEELLLCHYLNHFGLSKPVITDYIIQTNDDYFEIEDDENRELILHKDQNMGMAKFSNPAKLTLNISNYDKFLTKLPNAFQRGKGRCDLFMLCSQNRYFVLGEIKDSPEVGSYRKKAKKQLISSLKVLLEVPEILEVSNTKAVKRCCYFNKQSKAPESINATEAFGRLNAISTDGFKMENETIESYDFEFWEYTGAQVFQITN